LRYTEVSPAAPVQSWRRRLFGADRRPDEAVLARGRGRAVAQSEPNKILTPIVAIELSVVSLMGLEFPHRETADYWDFMYYSFTIAVCYQTSDVSVSSVRIRRVTLVHAILSFLFVTAIIGFVVNVISNVT